MTLRELATEGESKDPEKVSFAMPQQGVLPMICLDFLFLRRNRLEQNAWVEFPEATWEEDASSGCFDLRLSGFAGTRAAPNIQI